MKTLPLAAYLGIIPRSSSYNALKTISKSSPLYSTVSARAVEKSLWNFLCRYKKCGWRTNKRKQGRKFFAWARNLENLWGPSRKIPRTLQAVGTSGNCTSIRFTKWPISDRMSDREDAPNTPLQPARNFYNGRNRRDQHSRRGDRTARRSGKLRARKQDHLFECIVRSWHSLKSLADAFRDAERTRSQASERAIQLISPVTPTEKLSSRGTRH